MTAFRADTVLRALLDDPDWLAERCGLPPEALRAVLPHYLPLAEYFHRRQAEEQAPVVAGVQGPQGSGKTTLVHILQAVLTRYAELNVAVLSIDDIYLTRAERKRLADRVHPLFITRGVPGTHDPALGTRVLDALVQPGPTAIPRFDKARDDRVPERDWPTVEGPCDLVLFEGLWIGLPPIPEADLVEPINRLEADEDADGIWRAYANQALANAYPPLFSRCEYLVHIQVPDFEAVRRWRTAAEHKLRATLRARGDDTSRVMDDRALARFFAHYERFTAHAMATLPARADITLRLDRDHRVIDSSL